MARRESRLAPYLSNASQYGDYSQFRVTHRERMEQSEIFRVWQERLFNLAEREGRRFGLRLDDSMTAWDIWYNQVVQPMRREMWTSWEAWHDMPERYHTAVTEQRHRQEAVATLHVAATVADTRHLMEAGSQSLSVPETAGSAVPTLALQGERSTSETCSTDGPAVPIAALPREGSTSETCSTAGPAVPTSAPQRPAASAPAKVAPTRLQADNAPVPLAMGSVKGITPDNRISLAGDSWSF